MAGLIRERALIDNGWLAERLHMGARNAVSRIISQARNLAQTDRNAKRMKDQLERNVNLL